MEKAKLNFEEMYRIQLLERELNQRSKNLVKLVAYEEPDVTGVKKTREWKKENRYLNRYMLW